MKGHKSGGVPDERGAVQVEEVQEINYGEKLGAARCKRCKVQ